MTDEPPRTPNDAQKLCRFCLKQPDQPELALNWRHSEPEIPAIFQQLTGIQLDAAHSIDDDNYYSNLLCISCHNQMKLVVEIRQEFERVANCWQLMIERWRQDRHDDNISTAAAAIDYDQLDTTSDEEDGGRSSSSRRKTTPKSMPPANHLPIYECDICGHGGMQTKRLLQSHMTTHRRVHAKADRGTCHICGKTNLKWLSSHLQDHRKKDRFRCEFCQKGFSRRAQWVNHRRVHTGERPFVCEICAYTFTSASTLANHRKLHRIEEEAAATATPKPKRRHSLAPDVKHKFQKLMRTNRQPKHPAAETKPKLKCPLCSDNDDADNESVALYNNRQTMYQHLKLQHPRPAGIDAWKQMLATMCMECHRPFPDAAALAAHKIEHLDYECSICRRRFNNRLAMEFHVQRHSAKERAHKCEVCMATFTNRTALKYHFRRKHTDDRPHACESCDRRFTEAFDLGVHVRMVHSLARPYQCDECPKTYKTSSLLRMHKQTHSGDYLYNCRVCQRVCQSGPLLTAHMNDYHPGVDV